MDGNLSGLVELVLVVGLLGWFWRSQTQATRKDAPPGPGADPVPRARKEPPPGP